MTRRTQIVAVSLLVAVGIAAPATEAAKSKRFASEVEVSGANFGNEPPFEQRVVGDVHSKKPKCERNREVSLYITPSGGERELVGTATTDRTGDWEVLTNSAFSGDASFDATVTRLKLSRPGKDIVCKADESPPLVIAPVV